MQVAKTVELIKAKGGMVTRECRSIKGGKTVIAFIEDPDGYKFELIERGPTPEPLCQLMLRVGDLDRSIEFYAFGMELFRTRDNPQYKVSIFNGILMEGGLGDQFVVDFVNRVNHSMRPGEGFLKFTAISLLPNLVNACIKHSSDVPFLQSGPFAMGMPIQGVSLVDVNVEPIFYTSNDL